MSKNQLPAHRPSTPEPEKFGPFSYENATAGLQKCSQRVKRPRNRGVKGLLAVCARISRVRAEKFSDFRTKMHFSSSESPSHAIFEPKTQPPGFKSDPNVSSDLILRGRSHSLRISALGFTPDPETRFFRPPRDFCGHRSLRGPIWAATNQKVK